MRKSFIIHNDSLGVLDELTDEQAGKLFKAIAAYQRETDLSLDMLTKIAFAPFRAQFERDSVKYDAVCDRNKNNGSKGGRPKKEETQTNPENPVGFLETQTNPSEHKKADSNSDSVSKNKSKRFIPPSISDVKEYFLEKGYTEQSAIKAFNYYEVANWVDSQGVKVKNWKQKMQGVWFKPENKAQSTQPQKASNKGFMPARYDARGNMIIEPNKVLKNDTFGNPWGWFDPE